MELITSVKNQKIKDILKLQDYGARKDQNKYIIEGFREISFAIKCEHLIDSLIFCSDIINEKEVENLISKCRERPEVININRYVFEKIAYRDHKDGLIAVAESRTLKLEEIKLSNYPLIIILESVEKPGNLGAILRSADAANADAVIICEPKTDFFNPNTIRSSLGCVFNKQVVSAESANVVRWLKEKKIKICITYISKTSKPYFEINLCEPIAIVLGSEAFGLTDIWVSASDEQIIIPMNGEIDSLNVSVSCAIVLFEALRQRYYLK